MATEKYVLFCLGHPLLDIQVRNAEQLLIKYNLNADDAILAQEQHFPMQVSLQALLPSIKPSQLSRSDQRLRRNLCLWRRCSKYSSRGCSGSLSFRWHSIRLWQYILPPDSVVFVGCVGDDKLAELLRITNAREGVRDVYQVQRNAQTGACAVLLTGQNRYTTFCSWYVHFILQIFGYRTTLCQDALSRSYHIA